MHSKSRACCSSTREPSLACHRSLSPGFHAGTGMASVHASSRRTVVPCSAIAFEDSSQDFAGRRQLHFIRTASFNCSAMPVFASHQGGRLQIQDRRTTKTRYQMCASSASGAAPVASKPLKVGIVGFGNFGQFLAARLIQAGHTVLATSRTNYGKAAQEMGVYFTQEMDGFCEEHPDVVILASSILSTREVLESIPIERLKRNTLFMDVLSVKVFPKQILLAYLPPGMDILCTHPMFGPDSGRNSWNGLNFMYDKVRIGHKPDAQERCQKVLDFFRDQGCKMVEMSCEEHDRHAAGSQFITHTVGRMLGNMQPRSTPINTNGYQSLLNLVECTSNDSFDLYYGLFMYNQCAPDELERLEKALDEVKKNLFGRLHTMTRNNLLPRVAKMPLPPSEAQDNSQSRSQSHSQSRRQSRRQSRSQSRSQTGPSQTTSLPGSQPSPEVTSTPAVKEPMAR